MIPSEIISIILILQHNPIHDRELNFKSKILVNVFLPCEAFIEIEGELVTNVAADTPYPVDPNIRVGFVNNGIMALFESARYVLDGKEIEQ